MYTTPEFRLIRKHCLDDLRALLDNLSIPMPDFSVDEMKVYEQLDKAISKSVCFEMKSLTLVTGYLKILKMVRAKLKGDEDNDELIAKIIENEEKLLKVAEKNVPKLPPDLEKSLIVEKTEVMIAPIVFGGIFSLMTFFYTMFAETYFPMVTLIGTVAGMGCIIFGLRGEKRIRLAAPADRFVQLPPDVLNKEEMQTVLETLKIVNKINKVLRPPEDESEHQSAPAQAPSPKPQAPPKTAQAPAA